MSSWKWLAFIFLNMTYHFGYVKSQNYFCGSNGNYTSNSTYRANLNALLSSISSNMDSNGFYYTSLGENADRVNAIALCRGDVQLDTCQSCINNATRLILQLCPYQKQAFHSAPDDLCMLRYSNESIFGKLETEPKFSGYRIDNVTSKSEFNQDLRTLLDNLQSTAYSGSLKKFAAGNTTGPDMLTIFGLVQCTTDLTSKDCSTCLTEVTGVISQCCSGKQGFGILTPSCILRYETYPFFNDIPRPAPPPPQVSAPAPQILVPPGEDDNTTRPIIINTIVPIVAGLILALFIGIVIRMRRKSKPQEQYETDNEISTVESLHYDFGTIRAATNNFSDGNKLGQGGFGVVYKGILPSGQEIAVKRLSMNSGQGDLEFKNEVLLMARLQHRNLVRLLGFSLERSERLLVYEFVENGSLDRFVFDPSKHQYLDWETRYKIIGGIAKGVLYLHEDSRLRIIHRDLKASNVLLDGEMNPIYIYIYIIYIYECDCSLTIYLKTNNYSGYMAPEYAMHGQFSSKSDIFSFGVLVLEIISGQKISSFQNGEDVEDLLSCAWKNWHKGTSRHIIDPSLRCSAGSLHNIMRCIHIGLLCVQEDAAVRPTMAAIVLMLTSLSITLPIPSRPAFFVSSIFDPKISFLQEQNSRSTNATESSKNRSGNSTDASINEVSMSDLYPR
ncbi:putative receptor-like protein kinase At4g00960 [Olea europaea var. sylvestris]|uniref:putative receptor-like protein kinase At4g00960 n=1 Tax=Olea europaea var. sylvestris TaxID=158386 RepID=UPI000C1D6B9B|nr:putative receptor-like protein kinase At4g00960 [Olea europaea var. sylvestris]